MLLSYCEHKISEFCTNVRPGPLIENGGDLWNFLAVNEKIFRFSVISRPGNFVVKLYFKYQMSLAHGRQKENYNIVKYFSNSS